MVSLYCGVMKYPEVDGKVLQKGSSSRKSSKKCKFSRYLFKFTIFNFKKNRVKRNERYREISEKKI